MINKENEERFWDWQLAKFTFLEEPPKRFAVKEVWGVYQDPKGFTWSILLHFLSKPKGNIAYGVMDFLVGEAASKFLIPGYKGTLNQGARSLFDFEVGSLTGGDLHRLKLAGHWAHAPKEDIPRLYFNNQTGLLKLLSIWGDRTPNPEVKDVHTEHCCIEHGCKYCDDNCTVENGSKLQSYLCETCGSINSGYY